MSDKLHDLSLNYWKSGILRAAVKLDLFSLLEKQSLSANEVSQHLKAKNPRFVQAFLEACVVLELLDKEGSQFKNSAMSNEFLVPGKQKYFGDLARHITNHWNTWGKLDTLVLEGQTELPFENGFVDAPTYWTDYMMGQHNRAMMGQGKNLVENVDLSNKQKLLDLGGGTGSYSIALCQANPQLKAVIVDQKEPLEIAQRLVDENQLSDRITLIEGDMNTIELDNDYDMVLISGVVLIASEEMCLRVFRRVYKALRPGGVIVVQDYMQMDHSPKRRFLDTITDLYVLICFSPDAGDRFGDEVVSWLTKAEFTNAKQIPLPTHLALITAEKPTI
ncbi:O-methyltransferase, family 2 [Beggiatoa sp. PS]|nr:O-methyltransferase, family 2 [Beggiatoa sp. PS]